jgi:glycosyltransferase involved in cell wall biosynthesis
MTERSPSPPLRILHVILMLGETNSQYNEHCLPMVGTRDLTIVTYFVPRLSPPPEIALFAGDGTVRGFLRALRAALDAKGYDAIHLHAPESAAMAVFALVRWRRLGRLRSRLVYTVHDSFSDYRLRNQVLMLLTLRSFRRVVFCSRAAFDSYPRLWRRRVRDRWRVVPNGADLERVDRVLAASPPVSPPASPPVSPPAERGGFTVLSVGRLEKVKDPVALVSAFSAASEPADRLVFVGAGAQAPAVEERVRELGLRDRVLLTGLIPRDDVFRRCAAADLFVSTSHGEGLPVAVMEVMAAGCPVVLSDIPPHRELVDGVDFIPLVRPGDAQGFAREIRRFRDMPEADRVELGRRCRTHVTSRFNLHAMHAGYEVVYRELLPRDVTVPAP